MEQAYVHFKQSIFQGKKNKKTGNLEGEERLSQRIHPVEAFIPISLDVLPPHAEAYSRVVDEKGFIGQGNPILYVTANHIKELKEDGMSATHNLIAEWPAFHGHLQKRIGKNGFVSLKFCYSTKSVDCETFGTLKESCRIKDLTLDNTYNTCDLLKLIKNANWNARVGLFVKRMSHDSTLPVSFLEEINKGYEGLKGLIPNPERRTSLCEEVSINYFFEDGLILDNAQAFACLHPAGLYGGLSSSDMFDEFHPPIRQPRSWKITNQCDVLSAVAGQEGYDKIVSAQFTGDIPSHETLKGISLEKMLISVFPKVIDSVVDFVGN